MFDIGFSEIALIAVAALLVLGPERLPRAARTLGALLRRARSSWQNVRADIERELAAEDIKRSMREMKDSVQASDLHARVKTAAEDIRAAVETPTEKSRDERN
ncbi:MAG: Sec-independent protein translocase protein TatB [Rhodanobacteraceae bacterium]